MSSVNVSVSNHMPFLLVDALTGNYTAEVYLNGSSTQNCNIKSASCSVSSTEFKCTVACDPQSTPINVSTIRLVIKSGTETLFDTTWSCQNLNNVTGTLTMTISQTITIS